jgi:hypothetical protein
MFPCFAAFQALSLVMESSLGNRISPQQLADGRGIELIVVLSYTGCKPNAYIV